jgi:Bacterial TniB protein
MVVAETAWESRDQGREPTTTLSGWRKFVDAGPAKFDLLPDAAWSSLSPAGREAYNEARITYHSELVVVATSTLREVTKQGRLLTLLNRREISARRGLIVSGPWATGKSTAIKQLGRAYELMIRERAGGTDSNQNGTSDRIPVVYVTTPPKGSPRKLAMEFARFLGLPPIRTGWNTTDIADAVCQVLIDARCDLVLVDEIHNLNLATAAGEDMSDHLKYFTEHLPATFVYAGINVERSGLFTGVRGKQIAGRCVLASTGPFAYQQEWKSLVAAMESALRLHRHQAGTLPGIDRYLHQRTGGMIGSLSHLIRAGAMMAILEGSEAVTQELLDGIPVDHAAQSLREGAA